MQWAVMIAMMTLVGVSTLALGADRPRVLVLTQSMGFVHDVVKEKDSRPSVVQEVFSQMGQAGGFDVSFIGNVQDLTAERLAQTDVVAFYTTGDLPFADGQYEAFERWISDGGAFLGIHCATDTLKSHPRYPALIGGSFDSHPWGAGDMVTIKVHDDAHPAARPYAPQHTMKEEIYHFKAFWPEQVRTLMSLDMEKTAKKRPYHVPIAWCKQLGQGRVFYTSLGHNEAVWRSTEFQQHLQGAIDWLTKKRDADATPNLDLHERETATAKAAARE